MIVDGEWQPSLGMMHHGTAWSIDLRQLDGKAKLTYDEYSQKWDELQGEGIHRPLPQPLLCATLFETFMVERTTKEHFTKRLWAWLRNRSPIDYPITEDSAHRGQNEDWYAEWQRAKAAGVSLGWLPHDSFRSNAQMHGIIGDLGIGRMPPEAFTTKDGALIVGVHGALQSPRFAVNIGTDSAPRYAMSYPLGIVVSFKAYDIGPQLVGVEARCVSVCLSTYFREALQWIADTWDVRDLKDRFAPSRVSTFPANDMPSIAPVARQENERRVESTNFDRDLEICRLHFEERLTVKEIVAEIKKQAHEKGWRPIKSERVEQVYRMDPRHNPDDTQENGVEKA